MRAGVWGFARKSSSAQDFGSCTPYPNYFRASVGAIWESCFGLSARPDLTGTVETKMETTAFLGQYSREYIGPT